MNIEKASHRCGYGSAFLGYLTLKPLVSDDNEGHEARVKRAVRTKWDLERWINLIMNNILYYTQTIHSHVGPKRTTESRFQSTIGIAQQ